MINYGCLWVSVIKVCHMRPADATESLTETSCHHCTHRHLFPRENDFLSLSFCGCVCVRVLLFLGAVCASERVCVYLDSTPDGFELHLCVMWGCVCVCVFASSPPGLRADKDLKVRCSLSFLLPLQVITPKHSSRHTERQEAGTHSPRGSDGERGR